MEESQKRSAEKVEATATATATALDVEFLPLVLEHKIHRNLKSSQVEIVPLPHYYREPTPEPEPEPEMEMEPEVPPPTVIYAPPLPALKEKKNWWDFVKPVYAFNNPLIRTRVEILMSDNVVHVTDRKYMVRLQERIKEDHMDGLRRRIREREAEEIEREKQLLLAGKISFDQVAKELKSHPVCRINQMAKRIIEIKRAKMKAIDKTWSYKTPARKVRNAERIKRRDVLFEREVEENDASEASTVCVVDAEMEEDIANGQMFSREDYDRLKFEDPLIKLLRETEHVNDMYELADQILSSFKVAKVI